MIILPILAAAVSLAFSAALLQRYRTGRALHLLAWGVAMALFAVASVTVIGGIAGSWDPTLYRGFWLFGALLNVPWLAAGSIALVSKRPVGLAALGLVIAGSVFAVVAVIRDPVIAAAFDGGGIPSSEEAWGDSPQRALVNYYSILPYFVVVGIAAWTSRRRKGLVPSSARRRGNLLIAVGTTIVAIGGSALRRFDDSGAAFSVALAVGVTVMFVGFLSASRAPRFTVADPGESPT